MHAHALEELLPYLQQPSTSTATASVKILDVGCGSGYLTACLGRLVHATKNKESILGRPGQVFGVDIYPELVERTRGNILSSPVDCELLESKTIQLQVANGWEGLPEEAPFDAIHVGAAAESLPRALAQQLKVGGVLIVPIGPYGGAQKLYKIERVQQASNEFDESDYRVKALLGVQYVPLVKEL
jgi:protein-L-isoaspartate(D-aspartate) O-methyltransferase